MKVIVVDWTNHENPIIREGESEGKIVDDFYVRVWTKYDSQLLDLPEILYHAAEVYEDTPEVRDYVKATAKGFYEMKQKVNRYIQDGINYLYEKRAYKVAERDSQNARADD